MRKGTEMNDELVCELNLVLVPDEELANRQTGLSRHMSDHYVPVIELTSVEPRLGFAPHLTLYQVAVAMKDMPALRATLADLAVRKAPVSLQAIEYGANAQEGSFEVRYEPASDLMQLQDELIERVNPLRGTLLRERDPAGHKLIEALEEPGTKGDNIRRTGFDAVGDPASGGMFHPHSTINWFRIGSSVDLDGPELPAVSELSGRFVALGIYLLGPYGTCAQRLAEFKLGQEHERDPV